jgi:hypothetical protein
MAGLRDSREDDTRMNIRKYAKALAIIATAILMNGCAVVGLRGANPVEEAGLRDTVRIEVLEFNTWDPEAEPYVHRLDIADPGPISELVDALDVGLKVVLKVGCVPEYQLRFHLKDGEAQTFGYSCHGAAFLRGEQDFWEGEDYGPPEQFREALEELLSAAEPTHVNVAAEAGLGQTIRIEVYETITETVMTAEQGRPAVVTARVEHRLTLSDPQLIARVVKELDRPAALRSRAEVAKSVVLEFHLADGTMRSLGYSRGGSGDDVMHVGQLRQFAHRDAQRPAGLDSLVRELLADGVEGS